MAVAWVGTSPSLTPAGRQSAAADAPAEKTVDQVYKNIQVLKGLPESQLRPVMNLVASSLGVDCTFCHIRQGNEWAFEKDDKKHKQTARKMMQMVLEINKTNFEGKTEVTCYSCHVGHEHPVTVPPLPRARPEPPARPVAITPKEIVDKYIAAVGGVEAAAKLTTRFSKGTVIWPNGQSAPLEMWSAGPDRLLSVATDNRVGTIALGLNKSGGWIRNPREQRPMNPVELDHAKALAWSLEVLALKEPYPRLTFAGKQKIGEREAYLVRSVSQDKKPVQWFFDVESGLLLRRIVHTATPFGPDPEQIDFEDYRDVDGVKVPFTIKIMYLDTNPNFATTRKFTEIKHNVAVDDSKFANPGSN
jgi:hypothetical protein